MLTEQEAARNRHVQNVLSWRECLATLPDNQFFELMRMYLGEVKTPYNKQKLIEELGAFLRKEESRRTLVSLLSQTDLQIISAVSLIPDATQEKLNMFFSGTFSFAALYDRLLNLEERLILYRRHDQTGSCVLICVNPLLDDLLAPFISIKRLLPSGEYAEKYDTVPFTLTPQFIAAYLSYIAGNPDVCKADGTFKKRAISALAEIFPGKEHCLALLTAAFINLSLIKEGEDGFFVDYPRCVSFSQLSEQFQYAFLCVASCGRFSRDGFRLQAQMLLDCAASIPPSGFTRSVLQRSGMLISTRHGTEAGTAVSGGRFNRILEQYRSDAQRQETLTGETSQSVIERLIDTAAAFGIFVLSGKAADGQDMYTAGPGFTFSAAEPEYNDAVLSIDAGFTVTVMPGLPLAGMLPVIQFMDIVHYDAAAEYEISKKSVMRAFDGGSSPGQILNMLTDHALYEIPQNLRVSIDEWYHTYSSAVLYNGYVLKVDTTNDLLTQKNPLLAPHVRTVLAPGVYLLDVTTQGQADALIASCGFDFIGSVKTVKDTTQQSSFPALLPGQDRLKAGDSAPVAESGSEQYRAAFFSQMRDKLKALNLDEEHEESLAGRISRKIVLSETQLRPDSVRIEKNEASGMDFVGKIRIVERAIESNTMIEIGFDDKPVSGIRDTVAPRILGTPLGVEKKEGDALVRLRIEPEQIERLFSIGQAAFVKRIRGSIFKETPGRE